MTTLTKLLSASVLGAALIAVATPTLANGYHTKYNKERSTHNVSFKAVKSHAKKLNKHRGVRITNVKKHHGKVVGFTKTFKSGKKVVVNKGRHGKVHKTQLTRKTYLQRVKHRVSNTAKKWRHNARKLRHAVFGKPRRYAF